jgi:hypothetical protein
VLVTFRIADRWELSHMLMELARPRKWTVTNTQTFALPRLTSVSFRI